MHHFPTNLLQNVTPTPNINVVRYLGLFIIYNY